MILAKVSEKLLLPYAITVALQAMQPPLSAADVSQYACCLGPE